MCVSGHCRDPVLANCDQSDLNDRWLVKNESWLLMLRTGSYEVVFEPNISHRWSQKIFSMDNNSSTSKNWLFLSWHSASFVLHEIFHQFSWFVIWEDILVWLPIQSGDFSEPRDSKYLSTEPWGEGVQNNSQFGGWMGSRKFLAHPSETFWNGTARTGHL